MSDGTDHFKLDCAAVAGRSCSFRHDEQVNRLYDILKGVIRSGSLDCSLSGKEGRSACCEEEEGEEEEEEAEGGP